ncbi:coiled-coil domain-containing protein 178 isoform X3 [Archocentrus centrarchus]|uniref:coiled-coil domain-containing protein 178 isoform X3 n=1 Tax=Archocentrus centrarchus TaxID=63155 RepID=UPI0011E9BD52|nr:coiled-coil domain-containing protein 178 isoform X3 [Archocentrus centrarchus]
MPDVEPLRFPSREGQPSQQDQAELQAVCSGRRRTCALLNSPSPWVNSVIYHIQEMKMTVENKCQQQSGRYQSHINQNKHKSSKTLRFQSRDSDSDSVMSTDLYVEGFAICARESCPLSPVLKKINDVLSEVVYLIERLEADRQYAEEALLKEKKRKRFLESKLDSISLWRQKEHAHVVQKEHEACIRDITELKWQLKVEREKLDRAQEKLSCTEGLNQRLLKDISFANEQVPIVKEKIDLQKDLINQTNAKQAEANEVCSKLQHELLAVQNGFKNMELAAKNRKLSVDQSLLGMKNTLAKKMENLNQLKIIDDGLHVEMKDAEKTIALTEEKCTLITQRIPEMLELEKTEKDTIAQLNFQIEDEIHKNMKLQEKLISLQEDIEKTKLNGEAEVSCVEEQLESKRKTFAALRKENMQYEQSVENYKIKIFESEKAVKQMREERKQMLQKISDNDEKWEKAEEEVTQVIAQHSVIQAELEEQEQLTFMEEERARTEIESLRKDLTGQRTTLEQLKAQCADLNEQLKQQQRKSMVKNQQLQKEFEDASSVTKALETKMEEIKKMTDNLEKISCEHRKTLINLRNEKKQQCDHLKAVQELNSAVVKKYDNTMGRISDLMNKSQENRDASDKMEKIAERMPEVIAELQSVFDVLEFKNKSAALIMSTLQSDINNCQQRTQRSMQTHIAHVTARKKQMEGTKEALKIALKKNKQLASQYEDLRKILMEAKQESVSALSEKNSAHKSFHYYTQLSLLQKRMHKALVKYFKQRSLYSQAELDRCQALSQETDWKIKTAQEGMSEESELISAFLQSLTDDSTTTDDAMG